MRFVLFLALAASVPGAELAPENWKHLPRGLIEIDGRTVEFRIHDGYALIEGDIQIGPIEEISSSKRLGRAVSYIPGSQFRWTGNRIPYTIDPELPNRTRITEAVREWNEKTPIRLVPRTNEPNYLLFKRATSGCNSSVGMRGGEQRVNLADGCSTGNTIHEIGHTAGLWHTQSRTDRGNYLQVLYENIDKREWSQYSAQVLNGADLGPYDFSSIMHYSRTGFQRTYMPVMQTIPPGIPLGQRSALSPADIDSVRRLYGETPDIITIASNPSGLKLTVDGETIATPKTYQWQPGEKHTIAAPEIVTGASPSERWVFARWTDGGAKEHSIEVSRDTGFYIADYAQQFRVRTGTSPAEGGTVRVAPPAEDGWYAYGAKIRFTAEPADGFQFVQWLPGADGATHQAAHGLGVSANPSEIWVRLNNLYYIAVFSKLPLTTITSVPPGRTVTIDNVRTTTPRTFTWTPGSSHTVLVDTEKQLGPEETSRYLFRNWNIGSGSTQTITAGDTSSAVIAGFTAQYSVTPLVDYTITSGTTRPGTQDIVLSPAGDEGFFDAGITLSLSSRDADTFRFANWHGDLTGNARDSSAVVSDQMLVTANFLSNPFVNNSAVVSAATRQPAPVAPGSVVDIFGVNIGPETDTPGTPTESGYETKIDSVRVLFDNDAAQLVSASRGRITAIVPASVSGKRTVSLIVEGVTGRKQSRTLAVLEASPGIYTKDGSGNGPADVAGSLTPSSEVRFLVSGAGKLDELGRPLLPVALRIGGFEAEVISASADARLPAGVIGVLARIPDLAPARETLAVAITVGGNTSAPGPTITIEP